MGGGCSFPLEAWERLYVMHGRQAYRVRDLVELRGLVKIRTAREALSFCRLRTSPATYYAWDDEPLLEVVSRDEVDRAFCFGDEPSFMMVKGVSPGTYGIMDSKGQMMELLLAPTCVSRTGRTYEVRRTLYTNDGGNSHLLQVVESVGADGSYSRQVIGRLPLPVNPDVFWFVPYFL